MLELEDRFSPPPITSGSVYSPSLPLAHSPTPIASASIPADEHTLPRPPHGPALENKEPLVGNSFGNEVDARVGSAGNPSKADENNRFFGFINDRDDRLHLSLLSRRDHRVSVGCYGTREVHSQVTVVGLYIHNNSLVICQPLTEGLGTNELRSSDITGCVVGVPCEKSHKSGDDEDWRAD